MSASRLLAARTHHERSTRQLSKAIAQLANWELRNGAASAKIPRECVFRSTTIASSLSNRAFRGSSRIRFKATDILEPGQVGLAQLNEPKSWGISDMCSA